MTSMTSMTTLPRASSGLTVADLDDFPEDLVILAAPFDVRLDDVTQLEPDLVVAPRAQFTAKNLPGAPLLAIEILSPARA